MPIPGEHKTVQFRILAYAEPPRSGKMTPLSIANLGA